jgi:tetratricopeptide (TPR) repeat protein
MAYVGEKKQPDLALDDLDLAIDLDPENVFLRPYRVMALILADRIDEAAQEIDALDALFDDPNTPAQNLAGTICAIRAVLYKEWGELEAAEARYGECLERHPLDPTVISESVAFFSAKGDFERGNEILRRVIEEQPTRVVYRSRLASRLRAQKAFDEAEAVLREALELESPGLAGEVWTQLAIHHAELDDAAAAAEAYGQAVELAPEVSEAGWLTYADMLIAANRVDDALEVAKQLSDERYRSLVSARSSLQRGKPAEALEHFDTTLLLWPNNAGARYFAARAAEQVGDFDRAISEYRQSMRSDPGAGDTGIRLAKLLIALGDPQAAWVAIYHHTQAQPGDRTGRLLRLELALADPGPSLRAELAALSQTTLWPSAIALDLDTIARLRGADAALEQYDALVSSLTGEPDLTHPAGAPVLRSLVRFWSEVGEIEKAGQAVAAALEAHPDEPAFHSIAGLARELASADPSAGRDAYERAIALDPGESHALQALARIAGRVKDPQAAIRYLDRAAESEPWSAAIVIRAAELLEQSGGDPDEVEQRWQRALREFPWEPAPLQALARIALAQSDLDAARDLADRAVRLGGGNSALELLAAVHEARGESAEARSIRDQLENIEASVPN